MSHIKLQIVNSKINIRLFLKKRGYSMTRIIVLLFMLLFVSGSIIFIVSKSKGKSTINLMILGIEITLVGGIIAIDPNSNLGGIEYIIIFLGLILNIIGFSNDN